MKKALVILILLAFVGGGLFAQTVAVAGQIEAGIAVVKQEAAEKVSFGIVSPTAWVDGQRTQLLFTAANNDGTAGLLLRFRYDAFPTSNAGLAIHRGFAWLKFFDGMLEFRGGRYETTMANYDFAGDDLGVQYGVIALISPIDMITIGFGGFSPASLTEFATYEDGGLGIWGGLAANVPGLLGARLQLSFQDIGTHASLSANITALDAFPIILTAWMRNLDEFGDFGWFAVHAMIGVNIIDNLSINVGGTIGMAMWDETDPFIGAGAYLTYALGNVVPRLDFWFISGGTYNYAAGLTPLGATIYWGRASWNSDQTYINIRPSVQFRVNSACYLDTGVVVNFDMGDVPAAGGDGLSYGVFAAVRVNF